MDDCFLNLIYIMKKNILLLSFLCNFSLLLSAQTNVEKGLQSINRSSAEASINFWLVMNCKAVRQVFMVHV